MKVNNLKKRKSTKSGKTRTISKIQSSVANPQWKKVKLSGNLLSMDDGGAGLEGLLGLEILENYGGAISVTKGKHNKGKNSLLFKRENNIDSDDEDQLCCNKNERKKKKRKTKQAEGKKNTIAHYPPGRFVRRIPDCDGTSTVLTTDDLIVRDFVFH